MWPWRTPSGAGPVAIRFFVGELLRHLGESGAIVQDETGRFGLVGNLDALALPPSVRDVVTRRVFRLGDETLRVLSAAAVIGQDFALDILGDVIETNPDPLLDVLEQAATAALVVENPDDPSRYRFSHALIQHTLYQGTQRRPPSAPPPARGRGARRRGNEEQSSRVASPSSLDTGRRRPVPPMQPRRSTTAGEPAMPPRRRWP